MTICLRRNNRNDDLIISSSFTLWLTKIDKIVQLSGKFTSYNKHLYRDFAGPCISLSVKEPAKAGRIKITTVDVEPEHLRLVKDGVIDYLVGQIRELFTWLGAQFLFDMRHKTMQLSANDALAGIVPIPKTIITGSVEIDKTNVDIFLQHLSQKK